MTLLDRLRLLPCCFFDWGGNCGGAYLAQSWWQLIGWLVDACRWDELAVRCLHHRWSLAWKLHCASLAQWNVSSTAFEFAIWFDICVPRFHTSREPEESWLAARVFGFGLVCFLFWFLGWLFRDDLLVACDLLDQRQGTWSKNKFQTEPELLARSFRQSRSSSDPIADVCATNINERFEKKTSKGSLLRLVTGLQFVWFYFVVGLVRSFLIHMNWDSYELTGSCSIFSVSLKPLSLPALGVLIASQVGKENANCVWKNVKPQQADLISLLLEGKTFSFASPSPSSSPSFIIVIIIILIINFRSLFIDETMYFHQLISFLSFLFY